MTRHRTARILAFGLLVALAGRAEAHAHLRSSVPAAGTTDAASPTELDLAFSEGINLSFTGIVVTGPDQNSVPLGTARLGPDGDRTLVVPLASRLAPGLYRVDWHALAKDGHKTDGTYTFTIRP